MLLFSINRSRGYENPSLDIIVTEHCSIGGCPLEEACEHCYLIQSAISVAISYIISVYCEDYAGYFTVILSFLAFRFCSAYFIYLVSCKETNLDSVWGYKDNAESEQEDENLEKLKHVETENSKLRNTNIILKGELSSCEEENYKIEKTINILKEQLEDYEKLKEELDHTKGELLLTTQKLKKFEKKH
jgi:hypothetical protein